MTQRLIYYTDSDVFLADSLDLPDISDFFADILTFSRWMVQLKNHTGVRRRARGAERRPE